MIALRSRSQTLLNLADEGAVAANSASNELRVAEGNLKGPLLVISAEQSDVPGLPEGAFVAAEKALAERVSNSQYTVIPGSKHHYIMADHSQAVINAIDAWLANLK
jgi:pimeloyl-ACP methyl ester carboxylesterase